MIRKTEILLRIQHLQKGAGRVAVIFPRQLIYLVQHDHRIGGAAALHALHDPPRHRADICTPVSADLRLVADAAQADADIFPVQRPGNTLADTGFPCTGGAHKQQDGAGLLSVQGHHRDLLDDTLLDLFQAVVLFIQHLLRLF